MSPGRKLPYVILLSLGVVLLAGADPPSDPSGEAKEPSSEASEPKEGSATTYTNADLERMFGSSDPGPDSSSKAKPLPDALATIADEVAREQMRKKLIAEAEAEVQKNTTEVKKLEQRILRIKNPLLPRPEADMTPEEVGEWNGLSASQRVEATEARLRKVRAELSEAEAKLQKLGSS